MNFLGLSTKLSFSRFESNNKTRKADSCQIYDKIKMKIGITEGGKIQYKLKGEKYEHYDKFIIGCQQDMNNHDNVKNSGKGKPSL
jgi:hypothetical protein